MSDLTMKCDETHAPDLRSWLDSANEPGCDFPIQNLPFGIFKRKDHLEKPRGGVAIGDQILDLAVLGIKTGATLNGIAGMGRAAWKKIRKQLSRGLAQKKNQKRWSRYLLPMKQAQLFVPVDVGDYTDFYTGIHHATNIGRLLRPDNPLLPNYKWVPIGYHGRGSSILVSGTDVVRPRGQIKPPEGDPIHAPTRRLDYEAEVGFVVGPGNRLGKSVPIAKALDHVFGVVLLNDWSARDIQAWEYQPLGPFLAKSFATTISPWVVTLEALAPFRCPAYPRATDDPKPLSYLWDEEDQREGGFDIQVEMHLKTRSMNSPAWLSRGSFRDSYWTVAQLVAHHTSNGCNLRPGDLLGSGTISGATLDSYGSMMELTQGGKRPLELPGGENRAFLEDGDVVVQKGYCQNDTHVRIGFGEAAGAIRP
jgi:fumarylacetoacetase